MYMCVSVCVRARTSVCMYVPVSTGALKRPGKGIMSLEAKVSGGYEPPNMGAGELNLGP